MQSSLVTGSDFRGHTPESHCLRRRAGCDGDILFAAHPVANWNARDRAGKLGLPEHVAAVRVECTKPADGIADEYEITGRGDDRHHARALAVDPCGFPRRYRDRAHLSDLGLARLETRDIFDPH